MKPETFARMQAAAQHGCKFHREVLPLYNLARESGAKVIVELGTGHGCSTAALLAAAEDLGAVVYSADRNPRSVDRLPPEMKARFFNLSSWDPSLPEKMGVTEVDFIFIDTSHQAPQTESELALWMPKVKVGGWAVFHDTKVCRAGVTDPIVAYIGRHPEFTWQWSEDVTKGQFGLGLLRKLPKEA